MRLNSPSAALRADCRCSQRRHSRRCLVIPQQCPVCRRIRRPTQHRCQQIRRSCWKSSRLALSAPAHAGHPLPPPPILQSPILVQAQERARTRHPWLRHVLSWQPYTSSYRKLQLMPAAPAPRLLPRWRPRLALAFICVPAAGESSTFVCPFPPCRGSLEKDKSTR